jgi:Flp pilus assembly protein TadG
MNRSPRQAKLRTQGGVAVELACLLPLMIVLLAVPLLFGRVFWHYTVAQKASQDAVRFLAAANAAEIMTTNPDGTEVPVAAVARAIVLAEIAELRPGRSAPGIDVLCDGRGCFGAKIPRTVTVGVTMSMYDLALGGFTLEITGGRGITLEPVATTYYAYHTD